MTQEGQLTRQNQFQSCSWPRKRVVLLSDGLKRHKHARRKWFVTDAPLFFPAQLSHSWEVVHFISVTC